MTFANPLLSIYDTPRAPLESGVSDVPNVPDAACRSINNVLNSNTSRWELTRRKGLDELDVYAPSIHWWQPFRFADRTFSLSLRAASGAPTTCCIRNTRRWELSPTNWVRPFRHKHSVHIFSV